MPEAFEIATTSGPAKSFASLREALAAAVELLPEPPASSLDGVAIPILRRTPVRSLILARETGKTEAEEVLRLFRAPGQKGIHLDFRGGERDYSAAQVEGNTPEVLAVDMEYIYDRDHREFQGGGTGC
jgi:hypothetical protein